MMLLAVNILIVDDEQAIADLVELISKMRIIMSLSFTRQEGSGLY